MIALLTKAKGQTPKRGFGGKNDASFSSNMGSPIYTGSDSGSGSLQHNVSSNAFVPLGTRISDWYCMYICMYVYMYKMEIIYF